MNNQELIGVNDDKIDALILDVYDFIEKINSALNKIESEVDRVSLNCDCSAIRSLKTKFSEQRAYFPIISSDLVKYTEILMKVKARTIDFSSDLGMNIKRDSSKVEIPKLGK